LATITETGGTAAVAVALFFLLFVAMLNCSVLKGLWTLWREAKEGRHDAVRMEQKLASRGLVSRLLGSRGRSMITSSWHLYPVGLLMGLGLETASEIALLSMTASATSNGSVSLLGVLSLPILFAAGMSTFDTADSLIMTRLYSWTHRDPVRTLFFNIATTAMTVLIAFLVSAIYASGLAMQFLAWTWLEPLASLSEHFELMGYVIAGVFVVIWLTAFLIWRQMSKREAATKAQHEHEPYMSS
jgi:high-affinity nickel-transport protein